MQTFLLWADSLLIWLYRMTGNPLADYFIGTFILALATVLMGEATLGLLMRVNRMHMEALDRELALRHELSLGSRRSGDEEAYREHNRQANEAFGKVFFNMFTLSAASLWAVFMVLAWMQRRFMDIEFHIPLIGVSVGYVFTFLLMYVLARIVVKQVKAQALPSLHG